MLYAGWDISDASLAMTIDAAIEENTVQALTFDMLGEEILNKASGFTDTVDAILKVGAAQGQSFMVAGGNNGSPGPGCAYSAGHKELGYPAVSPYAIAVAGTTAIASDKGAMRRESAWPCSVGGVSETEPIPAWQAGSGLFNGATGRVIPDLALSTRDLTWWYLDWVADNSSGVSMATFAGLWARMQSAHGNNLGFAGPVLYEAGVQRPASFVDVTKGRNAYYRAGAGWDYVTGFGSPDAATFFSLLP